jgi:hypothetical protein
MEAVVGPLELRDKQRIKTAQITLLCRLTGVTLRDRQRSEHIRNLSEVNKMTDDIRKTRYLLDEMSLVK